ncbi:DUF5342 family protein [Sporosarcina sp. NPDC096371]|uniref:DUF5342 family protein n=1 Tax=Sporosarcina sp. NPDC096371 TaxID=3364530 RepID=UPI0037F82215
MLQNFEVIPPLFEGQVNERFQFKLKIEGNDYRGIYHDKEVQWYQPHPHDKIEQDDLDSLESNVHTLMTNHLMQ